MLQLICHLFGDYVFQPGWMAAGKRAPGWRGFAIATLHAICYTLPFLCITLSPLALATIAGTHLLIDRYGLRDLYCRRFLKTSGGPIWEELIPVVVDNAWHLAINYAAIRWL